MNEPDKLKCIDDAIREARAENRGITVEHLLGERITPGMFDFSPDYRDRWR